VIRRRIVLAYWIIALGFFTPGAVYAYIDPATTTYIIQIITALVVTVGVSLSIFLYRFRMASAKARYGLLGLIHRIRRVRNGRAMRAPTTTDRTDAQCALLQLQPAGYRTDAQCAPLRLKRGVRDGRAMRAPTFVKQRVCRFLCSLYM